MYSKNILSKIILFLSSGAYIGHIPFAPGTFGSFLALGIYLTLAESSTYLYYFVLSITFMLAVWTSHKTERILQEKDSQKIVIDEIAGFFLLSY